MEEREERGREVPAKWVGLVGPIETVGSSGVVVETVLGLVVVFEHVGEFVFVHVLMLLLLVRGGRRRRGREGTHGLW